jgi:predicted secreted protein
LRVNLLLNALLSVLLAGASLLAQAQPGLAAPLQNVAQLSVTGSVEAQQDWLSMSLTTTRDGPDANSVQSQLKVALDAALVEARKAAVPGQLEVRTGNFWLYPRQGRDGKLAGWQGSAELVLEGKDFIRIGATAGRIQSMVLGQVGFGLSRELRSRTELEAQNQAIELFKARAAEISRSFGFASYTLREVTVQANAQGPMPRQRAMALELGKAAADAPVPVEAGKAVVQVTVSGSIQMK